LVARPLGFIELINCASPAYLQRHGTPRGPLDLAAHEVVDYVSPTSGRSAPWEWVEGGETRTMQPRSRVSANHAETYIACALAGLGLIQIPAFDVQHHLLAGELVPVMHDAQAPPMPVHLVYPHRKHLSRRLQAFMLWLEGRMGPHLQVQT
jgi:DNA-binding transcriptional LysR family regulator